MKDLEVITQVLKNRGFLFPSADIYGGLSGFYDLGHLGVILKKKLVDFWLRKIVFERDDMFLVEASLIGPKILYTASGHLSNFYDELVECKECHLRYRYDHLLSGGYGKVKKNGEKVVCPNCQGELTEPKHFNLMFKTFVGPVEEEANEAYLRPETAQGIFINFKNIQQSMRAKLPFGIAQVGKAFRNEITPKNFIFRIREFNQMEIEYFVKPEQARQYFQFWINERVNWYQKLGFPKEKIKVYQIPKDDLAFYSAEGVDLLYQFPFGWDEIEGIQNRTDYDLKRHQEFSGKDLSYFDEETKEKFIPCVIEPSCGVERILFAIFWEFFDQENVKGEKRNIFRFPPFLAPIEVAVLPLLHNRDELIKKAKEIYQMLKKEFLVFYDETGSIGRRYRRQDEIGTPYCLTVDFQTLEDNTITIRDRDTMEQERIKIPEIKDILAEKLKLPD